MKNATRMGSLTAALLLACAAGNAMAASTPAAASTAPAKSTPAQATPTKETPAKDTPAQPAPATDDALDNANTGPISEAEYMTRAEMSFNKRDVNADGYLSRSPLLQEATVEQVVAMDTDGDGRISKAEYLAYMLKNFRARPKFEHGIKR
ncbi:EF-hand domain-containing protein [Achromobacter xylosoxidans]|uniref:EF-hand domain-containing protein n=1 Tax=Alcaligenes xylosoxydans xylosoxydans TaxID=85698 RepID=UPI002ACA9785|nr:EF-hand domain-containing protein [Achromobacter xylosoxidans]MDZ5614638.1 EF-hand domain-containing protein [Achromobacter xylosoxidans]MDZ5625370.1 EF-hand domain-containing protein [Achromobacter xylosoxidans]MDZ5685634.1 EF-hand domain-containing protein [Achromobacter xylosoxidans]